MRVILKNHLEITGDFRSMKTQIVRHIASAFGLMLVALGLSGCVAWGTREYRGGKDHYFSIIGPVSASTETNFVGQAQTTYPQYYVYADGSPAQLGYYPYYDNSGARYSVGRGGYYSGYGYSRNNYRPAHYPVRPTVVYSNGYSYTYAPPANSVYRRNQHQQGWTR